MANKNMFYNNLGFKIRKERINYTFMEKNVWKELPYLP